MIPPAPSFSLGSDAMLVDVRYCDGQHSIQTALFSDEVRQSGSFGMFCLKVRHQSPLLDSVFKLTGLSAGIAQFQVQGCSLRDLAGSKCQGSMYRSICPA